MKKILKSRLFFFILGVIISSGLVFAYSYVANDVGFTPKDATWEVDNTKDALDDLYNYMKIEPNNLKLFQGTTSFSVQNHKKYVIFISITSYTSQNYKPSIVSGCKIEKEMNMIGRTYGELTSYAKSYLVTATSNTITISGNLADAGWNFVSYYKIN